ncbi:MAG: 30S ribosomal protein S6 [Candidatus Dormibacteria bacterium]
MVRDYELMYLVRPDLDEDALNQTVSSVRDIIEGQGGEVVKTTLWGKRRLAYEVRSLRDGFYVIDDVRLESSRIGELESALRIHDQVFRHMLVVHEGPIEARSTQPPDPIEELDEASPGGETLPVINEEELDAVPAAVDGDDL